MSDKYLRKILSTAIAATLVTEAVPLLAQTGALEEVVVTARKREESILKGIDPQGTGDRIGLFG